MVFSSEWDERYKKNTHMSIWPWSDLVSYVMRYARPQERPLSVLELGVGAGANIPFFLDIAAQYCAIEGSASIVERLHAKYPQLKKNLRIADFTREIPFEGPFDLVADRSSLTHNATEAVSHSLDLVYKKLTPGGLFIGIDWFSTQHSAYSQGSPAEDEFTRAGYETGPMAHVGRVHFSDEVHLKKLFYKFEFLVLEHKSVERLTPHDGTRFAAWNFVAVRK